MIIQSLQVENFRHLASQNFEFDSRFNLIVGKNASGKTSLLESVYYLSQVRSFRTSRINQAICDGKDFFRVIAGLYSADLELHSHLGIERSRSEIRVRQDGETIQKRSHLAKLLPMLFLGPDTGNNLMEEPKARRQYLDWGLFQNYEHYLRVWQRYERALSQRNAGLKGHSSDAVLNSIEEEFAESGEQLHLARSNFLTEITPYIVTLLNRLIREENWIIEYHAGFTPTKLREELEESRARDRQMTFTRLGPHRGDFTLKYSGKPVAQHLSRGQIKLVTIALMLAQIQLHQSLKQSSTILLMDDLTAELDKDRRLILLEELIAQKSQLFVTCLETDEFPELTDSALKTMMSHYQLNDGVAQKMV